MRPLASIYNHKVPGFMKTQVGFDPIQKRNSNPKRKVKRACRSVDRPVDRPMPRSTGPVDHAQPRASPCQSVDRPGRPLLPVHARARRSTGRSTGLLHRSTGRSTGSTIWPAQCAVSRSFVVRSLCYLLPSPLSPLSHTIYNSACLAGLGFLFSSNCSIFVLIKPR